MGGIGAGDRSQQWEEQDKTKTGKKLTPQHHVHHTWTQKTYSSLDCKCGVAASEADLEGLITYAATRRAELPQNVCRSMSLITGILHVDHW